MNVKKPEGSRDESADYTDITEGHNLHTTSQGINCNTIKEMAVYKYEFSIYKR